MATSFPQTFTTTEGHDNEREQDTYNNSGGACLAYAASAMSFAGSGKPINNTTMPKPNT